MRFVRRNRRQILSPTDRANEVNKILAREITGGNRSRVINIIAQQITFKNTEHEHKYQTRIHQKVEIIFLRHFLYGFWFIFFSVYSADDCERLHCERFIHEPLARRNGRPLPTLSTLNKSSLS